METFSYARIKMKIERSDNLIIIFPAQNVNRKMKKLSEIIQNRIKWIKMELKKDKYHIGKFE